MDYPQLDGFLRRPAEPSPLVKCPYCGRTYDARKTIPHDPHGCHGCTTRLIDLSICQICRDPLPVTAAGRREMVPGARLCDLCGAPKLAEARETPASSPATALTTAEL